VEFAFKYMGIQYNCSRFASSQCLLIPPMTAHIRKRWKRNIQVNGERNSARGPYVSFLETRNAQGGTSIVSWKRNTRKIRVCFLCFHFPVFRLRPYPMYGFTRISSPVSSYCVYLLILVLPCIIKKKLGFAQNPSF